MDNDEKTAPLGDETLPPIGDEPSQDQPDALAATVKDADAGVKSAKTLPFPGPRNEPPPPPNLDDSFGMPDFAFFGDSPIKEVKAPPPPPESVVEMPSVIASNVSDAAVSDIAAPNAALPLQEGTGWETVGSIMKSTSLRARIEAQEESQEAEADAAEALFANDDEMPPAPEAEKPAAPRHEANVTPFPGVQRHSERVPSDMLRGGGKSADVFEEISSRAVDEQLPAVAEAPANPDALADAVQSALRNIYGSYSEQPDDRVETGGFTVADALAGADNSPDEPAWAEEHALSAPEWQQGARSRDYEAPVEAEAPDSEGVLDYFYTQQRRQEQRPATQLSSEMSLNDYAARTAREEKWQDEEPEEEPQRVMQFPTRDRSQTNYRGRPPELSTVGEMPIGRNPGFFREDTVPVRPTLEAEWGQPSSYGAPPQNARGSISPTYAPTATPNEQLPPPQGPDSGHLLGAAGLGLIGGIALAGVLAVFVFNSFVDDTGQSGQDGPKVVERLAPALTTANPLETRSLPETRSAEAPVSTQAAPAPLAQPAPPPEPQRQAALTPAPQPPEAAKPKLSAAPVSGAPDSPIRLSITLGNVETGDALVSLKGLPKDARLSTGIDVGGGQWLLPPGRLKDLTVTVPGSAIGNHSLEAQLLKDDAQTSISDVVPFTLGVGAAAPSAPAVAAPAGQKPDAARLAVLPDEAPLPETDFLTQMLIRDGNKKMREGDIAGARRLYEQAAASGNAEAALAMGRSYDPTYFEKLNVRTGKPDPATAFEWYKKALDGGLVTAKVKIDALKQWLQR